MTRTRHSHRGFTLIEMTVVLFAMGIAMAMGVALIVTAMKAATVGETTSERFSQLAELSRLFRADVAQAEAAPERVDNTVAGPGALILKMPDGTTVLYLKGEESLDRVERTGKKEQVRRFPLDRPDTKTEFISTATGPKLITLRLTTKKDAGPGKTTEFSAALGGDLR